MKSNNKRNTNPKLQWEEVSCYYLDSEGDKNFLSEEEDLADALKYKDDKKMKHL